MPSQFFDFRPTPADDTTFANDEILNLSRRKWLQFGTVHEDTIKFPQGVLLFYVKAENLANRAIEILLGTIPPLLDFFAILWSLFVNFTSSSLLQPLASCFFNVLASLIFRCDQFHYKYYKKCCTNGAIVLFYFKTYKNHRTKTTLTYE